MMAIYKLRQLIRIVFDWFGSMFSSSWSYDFVKVFSYLIFFVFVIGIIIFILSYFLRSWKPIQKIIWLKGHSSPLQFVIKWWFFVIIFVSAYIITSNSIGKILTNVSTVKEDGFIIDIEDENWTNDPEVDIKVKRLSSYLSPIEFPWYSDASDAKGANAKYSWIRSVVYKEVYLDKTKVWFSTSTRSWTWLESLSYKTILAWATWPEAWDVLTHQGTVYFMNLGNFLRKAKQFVNCSPDETQINITNLGSDMYSAMVEAFPAIKQDKAANDVIFDISNDISKVFKEASKQYIMITKDNIKDILNSENASLTYAEDIYQDLAKQLICMPSWKQNAEEKKEETTTTPSQENPQTPAENDKPQVSSNANLVGWNHNSQILKMEEGLANILLLKKYSLDNLNEAKTNDQKFLLLSSILDNSLQANTWYSGLSFEHESSQSQDFESKMFISQNDYNALTIPFLIDIIDWDKIVNYWMCSYYIFDWWLERTLKSYGLKYMTWLLNTGCGDSFWWLYNYKNSTIHRLGKQTYNTALEYIEKGKLVPASNVANATGEDAYIKYGFYQRWTNNFQQQQFAYVGEDIISSPFVETYKHKVDEFNIVASSMHWVKNILFSFFLYMLPWVFLALIFKIIRF